MKRFKARVSWLVAVSQGGGLQLQATGSAAVTLRDLLLEDNRCAAGPSLTHSGCGINLSLAQSSTAAR